MQFLYINILFFMFIPSIVLMFLIMTKKDLFSQYFNEETLKKLNVSNKYLSKKIRNVLLFLSLFLMIIALARPVMNEKEHNTEQNLNAIIIAIDISKSMLANDIYPNRLTFAKKKLLEIIDASKDSAIGVVLFAKSSFILSPLTQDFNSLKVLLDNLDNNMNFDNGTNIFSTLETTNKLLKKYTNKNLIILSDGSDKNEFKEEIYFANKNEINVYIIATATEKGSAIKLADGDYLTNNKNEIVTVKLNNKIKELAFGTGGAYINYTLTNSDVQQILNEISSKSQKQEFKSQKIKTYTELFYYPLFLGIILLLISFSSFPSFKKKKNLIMFFLCGFLFLVNPHKVKANILDFKTIDKANELYKNKDYTNAINEYKKIDSSVQRDYNIANSLYNDGKYKEAIKEYQNIKSDDNNLNFKKLHNLGNSYVKTKDLNKALETYKEALKLKDDPQTKENYETVKKALEDQKKKKDQKNDKKDDKKQKDDDKKQDDKKNEDKENQKKSDEKKKEEEKNKKDQKHKDDKKQSDKKEFKEKEISDLEEKKWLKQLKHRKTNSLLKKVESSKGENNSINPW